MASGQVYYLAGLDDWACNLVTVGRDIIIVIALGVFINLLSTQRCLRLRRHSGSFRVAARRQLFPDQAMIRFIVDLYLLLLLLV